MKRIILLTAIVIALAAVLIWFVSAGNSADTSEAPASDAMPENRRTYSLPDDELDEAQTASVQSSGESGFEPTAPISGGESGDISPAPDAGNAERSESLPSPSPAPAPSPTPAPTPTPAPAPSSEDNNTGVLELPDDEL